MSDDPRSPPSASSTSSALAGGRAFLLGAGLLVVVRMCLPAHAPSLVDAHVCLAALALALVARAPTHALAAAGFVVSGALLSVPTSWDPWISLIALPAALGPAAFFLVASTGSCRPAMLAGLGAGGALNAIAALVQKTITWPDQLKRADELGLDPATIGLLQAARPLGLSLSPDLCGGLCLAGAFAAFALAIDLEGDARRPQRIALVAVAAVSASGVFVVKSFGTALALVVGVGVVALLVFARRSLKQAVVLGVGGLVIAAIAIALAVSLRGSDAMFVSAAERVENWRAAWSAFLEHPVLGVGFMRFPAAYLAYRSPDANMTRYAHSTPLEWLCEGGVVGALLVGAAFAAGVRALWRKRDALTLSDVVLVGAAAAIGLRLCIDYDGHVAQTASVAGVVWGLVLAKRDPGPAGSTQQRIVGMFAILALLLTGVLFWRQGALESDDPGALESYSARFPFDVEPRLKIGALALDQLDICKRSDGCLEYAKKAHDALDPIADREHPPSAALVLRARVLLIEGKVDAALHDVDRALAVDPGNAQAHLIGLSIEKSEARESNATRWHVTLPE